MKNSNLFVCESCFTEHPKWQGKCTNCGTWNSLVPESKVSKSKSNPLRAKTIADLGIDNQSRLLTKFEEVDRVLGGGFVEGSVILLGGDPGVGKSTLMLTISNYLSKTGIKSLYVSGEETQGQIGLRSKRLGIVDKNVLVVCEKKWESIKDEISGVDPDFLIIDSIQTTSLGDSSYSSGSASQLKEVTQEIISYVKSKNIPCIIIGHITKEGSIAGPKYIEHMVDVVLQFGKGFEDEDRILRVKKNRFGTTEEIGLFSMNNDGLSERKFSYNNSKGSSVGKVLSCVNEGERSFVIETQSLVAKNRINNIKKVTEGYDLTRLNLILAILDRYTSVDVEDNDIYLNIVGFKKIKSRDSDLGVLASLYSSFKNLKYPDSTAFIGEVSLAGEVYPLKLYKSRLSELKRAGVKRLVCNLRRQKPIGDFEIVQVSTVDELEKVL